MSFMLSFHVRHLCCVFLMCRVVLMCGSSSSAIVFLCLPAVPVSSYMVAGLAVLFALLLVVSSGLVFFWCRVPFTLVLRDKLGWHSNASGGDTSDRGH